MKDADDAATKIVVMSSGERPAPPIERGAVSSDPAMDPHPCRVLLRPGSGRRVG